MPSRRPRVSTRPPPASPVPAGRAADTSRLPAEGPLNRTRAVEGPGRVTARQTTTDSASTRSRPTTEMIVSITDQLLMVWPTRHAEVLLDQPEARVVHVREEQRAGRRWPVRAARRCWLSSPPARGATMPAAVMVATVAEPVASRMPTATSQPSTSALMLRFSRGPGPRGHRRPASTSTCLKPPPAATISRMPAIAGQGAAEGRRDLLPAESDGGAEREHRQDDAGQQRDHRGADDVEDRPEAAALVEGELPDGPQQHEHDRQQDGGDRGTEPRESPGSASRRPCRPPSAVPRW